MKNNQQPKPQKVAEITLTLYDDGVVMRDCYEIIKLQRMGTKKISVNKEELKSVFSANNSIFNIENALNGTKSLSDIVSSES